ncbi:MAG TPA: chloride channel protein [Cyclobacteriaceae bacterium]
MKGSSRFNPFVFSRSFFLWASLGIIGGIVAGLYWIVLEFMLGFLERYQGVSVIAVMTIAGLLAGLIIHFIGNPGEIELIVNNIRFNKGQLEPRNNPSMILSSLFCISAGGSAGPEAPLVQVTGSIGSWLAKKLRLKGEDFRSFTIAGMASGFTSLFGAPLGGSLFALEILHHKYVVEYYEALIPAFVSSCASYIVFTLVTHIGLGPTWTFPQYQSHGLDDFYFAILYGMIGALIGWIFIFSVRKFKALFNLVPGPIFIKTALGGLILGVFAYYLPITRYFGHDQINEVIHARFGLSMLAIIIVAKILTISITATSGWRGGFIIPLFFVGTCLGLLIERIFPGQNVALLLVCCMASINACVTRTPISTIILLSTLTGFGHFIPIMFASLTGFFMAPKTPFIGAQLGVHPHTAEE